MRRSDSNEVLFPVDKISVKLKHQSQRRNDMRFETDPSPTQLPTGKKHALKIYDQFAPNAFWEVPDQILPYFLLQK